MGAEPSLIPTKLPGSRGAQELTAEAASLDEEGGQRAGVCKAGLGAHGFTLFPSPQCPPDHFAQPHPSLQAPLASLGKPSQVASPGCGHEIAPAAPQNLLGKLPTAAVLP